MSGDPRATYRLQLREGMDFAKAAALAPYLRRLGVSHLYLSPIWTAAPGSTHGYDVCDANQVEAALGGRAGFAKLADAMAAEGLRVVLDIVPNHMAAHEANPWWASVLRWGEASRHAGHFDIDWTADRLLLPILGAPYLEALEGGALGVARDRDGFSMTVYDRALPLTPRSWALILAEAGDALAPLARAFGVATPDAAEALAPRLDAADQSALEAACAAVAADRAKLHRLHEAQPWRLAHWRMAREALTYRRFFEITDLVGVRVERPEVFEDVHRLLFTLIGEGRVHGLRIDHVDGLADPAGYLRRLRDRVGPGVPIWVEKILHRGEALRPSWPVEGTTGYEFAADMADLMAAPEAAAPLEAAYAEARGGPVSFTALVDGAKRHILTHNLSAELDGLTDAVLALARRQLATRDLGRDTLRRSIIEMARALPVYRTYVTAEGPSAEDIALIEAIEADAKAAREVENEIGVEFVARLLRLDLPDLADQIAALGFAVRFQQMTGPVTAKALEDTVFYRFNRLIGLNEVGGAPERMGADPADVHAALAARRATPLTLNGTASHDTKRGEDARARLYAITLAPERWAALAARWRAATDGFWDGAADGDVTWTFLQTLLGVWPPDLAPDNAAGVRALAGRVAAFFEKAGREAKARTSWTQIDDAYEARVRGFVGRALDPDGAADFLSGFAAGARPFIEAGAALALGQTAIKLCAPGVPDLYQGAEGGDFSLVDPDNRRAPDFAALARAAEAEAPEGRFAKTGLIRAVLAARAAAPEAFAGDYVPLPDPAGRLFAFARSGGGRAVVCAVPIRGAVGAAFGLSDGPAEAATAALPEALAGWSARGVWGAGAVAEGRLSVPAGSGAAVLLLEPTG